jgi:mevalonate kinase
MVVILILAIAITHLIRYGKQLTEGFKDDDMDSKEDAEDETEEKTEEKTEESDDSFRSKIDETDESVKDASNALEKGDLTTKTQQLLKTQKDLMKNMEAMGPLLKDAETFLSRRKEKFTSLAEAYENHSTTKPK